MSNAEEVSNKLTFECLPGAVVNLVMDGAETAESNGNQRNEFFLPLYSTDDGRTLRLWVERPYVYVNGVAVAIDFTKVQDLASWTKHNIAGDSGDDEEPIVFGSRTAVKRSKLRMIIIPLKDEAVPILDWLRGSGVGIWAHKEEGQTKISQNVVRALAGVEPRQLITNCETLAELDYRSPALESLFVGGALSQDAPDLSGFPNLRHLFWSTAQGDRPEDNLDQVKDLAQLRVRKPKFGGPIRTALRNQRSTDV